MRQQALAVAVIAMLGACRRTEPRTDPGAELERTAKRLWTECHGGSAASCLELDGVLAGAERGVTAVRLRNHYDTRRLQEQACKGGHGPSCYEVARRAPARVRNVDLERGCAADHAASCKDLGDWHMVGYFGEPDVDEAVAAYTRACELGDRDACRLRDDAAAPKPEREPIRAHDL